MKSRITILLLAAATLAATATPARAMRCGTSLIVEGMSRFEVLQRCGQPAQTDGYIDYRRALPNGAIPRPLESFGATYPGLALRAVRVEEWVYNFGPTQLMQSLIFENGRLLEIRSLGYGM